MSCPTCDHTVQRIGSMEPPYHRVPLFWCPRCGTVKGNVVGLGHVPQLVGSVIEFASGLTEDDEEIIERFEDSPSQSAARPTRFRPAASGSFFGVIACLNG